MGLFCEVTMEAIRNKFDPEVFRLMKQTASFACLSITDEQISEFAQMMKNRMTVGQYRYGNVHARYEDEGVNFDLLNWSIPDMRKRLRLKLDMFHETHNREMLLDVANYSMFLVMLEDDPYDAQAHLSIGGWCIGFFWETEEDPDYHFHSLDQGDDAHDLTEPHAKAFRYARSGD